MVHPQQGIQAAGQASILPPLFRGGYPGGPAINRRNIHYMLRSCRPFSEAVISGLSRKCSRLLTLRSCRPFSEAVIAPFPAAAMGYCYVLRSCRPFSEAVIGSSPARNSSRGTGFDLAAPFQRRLYGSYRPAHVPGADASILPPLFRGGYGAQTNLTDFEIAASILPPLFRGGYVPDPATRRNHRGLASILPPLFRGGYQGSPRWGGIR